jgi:succinoglycan biosynthesis transport protein ExoP
MELLNLYTAILRRKWLLIQAIIFFTVAGALTAMLLPKSYQASAKMAISSSDADMSILSDLGLQEMALSLSGASDDIQNHIARATTRPILEQVIWRLQLRDTDGDLLMSDKLLVPGLEAMYLAPPYVEVKQYNGTDIITVTAFSDNPDLSRLMADTLVRVYIADTQEQARKETRNAGLFVKERMVNIRGEFDRALANISDIQQREQIIDLDSEIRSAVLRQSELVMSVEEVGSKIQEVRAQIAAYNNFNSRETVDSVGPAKVSSNPELRGLNEDITELEKQRESLLLDKTEKHPDVVRIDTQLAALREQLGAKLAVHVNKDPVVQGLEAELAGLIQRQQEIHASIERTTDEFAQYPEKLRMVSELQLAADVAEEVYRSLQEQSYQIQIAEAMTTAPLQFIEPAMKPDRHVSPKLMVNTLIGVALGVLVGLGLVVLFEYVDDSIKNPEELREVWDVPQLGVIPRFKAGVGVTINNFAPTDPVFEAFRTLRSSIAYASLDTPTRLMMITSSIPSEGKSTVLSSLGVSLANEGKRVLVVDCDLRRPAQHKFWPKGHNRFGVTDVLMGDKTIEEAVQPTEVNGLSLLSAGKVPPNPGKLVESLKLRQLLLEVTKRYDIVLVDAPPVLVVNDALLMARLVDHVLMVVESAGTPRRILSEARDRLLGGGIEPLGVVINKLDYGLAGYGYYKKVYQSYYLDSEQAKGGAA